MPLKIKIMTYVERFQNRNNGELENIRNFINRVVVLTKKYYESYIPANNELLDKDKNVLDLVNQSINKVEESLSNFKFRDACSEFMNIARIEINTLMRNHGK